MSRKMLIARHKGCAGFLAENYGDLCYMATEVGEVHSTDNHTIQDQIKSWQYLK
jgi:hypothetical protein